MRDEGIGVRVIQAMQGTRLPPGIELYDGGTAGADLLDVICDREKIIVIDALDGDAEPGAVSRLTLDDLAPNEATAISLHEIGLLDTFVMAKHLRAAPKEVVIFGVKPKEVCTGDQLSEEIAAAVPTIIQRVMDELTK